MHWQFAESLRASSHLHKKCGDRSCLYLDQGDVAGTGSRAHLSLFYLDPRGLGSARAPRDGTCPRLGGRVPAAGGGPAQPPQPRPAQPSAAYPELPGWRLRDPSLGCSAPGLLHPGLDEALLEGAWSCCSALAGALRRGGGASAPHRNPFVCF